MSHEPSGDGLNLLSIDNRGPDCIGSIIILDKLMQSLQNAGNLPAKPNIKNVFQMVVGTGTGGIIGLMGGKLDMNTDDMIREFSTLGKRVFCEEKLTITNGSPNARRYKKELRKMVGKHGGDADKRMLDGHLEDETCLVAVTAMAPHNLDDGIPSVFRTYRAPEDQLSDCAIWEAMCATSANHGLFKSMEIGPPVQRERFVSDGYSNPMAILLSEATRMFPNRHISCIVSVGDGQVSIMKMPDRDLVRRMLLPQSAGKSLRMATDGEQVIQEMEMRFQDTTNIFFQLDLGQGAQDAKVDRWSQLSEIVPHIGLNPQTKATDEQIDKAAASISAKRANVPTVQLGGKIQQATPAIPILSHCPEPTRLFTGCASKLKKIQKYLTGDTVKQKVFVVHGISGTGKTQLVLEFARRSQGRFSEIMYINSSSQQNISLGLKGLAALKNLEPTNDSALRWLASPSRNWLLIFDNVDDPSVGVQDYFPRCSHGSIVVITQDCDLQRLAEGSKSCCQVGELDPESALELLLKAAHLNGNKSSNLEAAEASEIVKDLGYLALAIVQAGAYILRSGCSLAEYRQNYQYRRHELESHRIGFPEAEDYQLNIYATWRLSLDRLRPKSRGLLQLISFLHHNGISTSIFEHASLNADNYEPTFPMTSLELEALKNIKQLLESFLDDNGNWDLQQFLAVMSEVRSFSLVSYDRISGFYYIHKLFQTWVRTTMHSKESTGLSATLLLVLGTGQLRQTSTDITFRRLFLPHIVETRQHHEITANTAEHFAVAYDEAGDREQAAILYSNLLDICRQELGEKHSSTLASMSTLALVYSDQGRWQDAEKLQFQVMGFRKRLLGQDHPDTLTSMRSLAATYASQSRWAEAEMLQAEALEIRKRVLGEAHPETLAITDSLAATYRGQGRWEQAVKLWAEMLEVQAQVLGQEHPDTLASMNNLSIAYSHQGLWNKSADMALKLLGIRKRVLGEAHPDTLKIANNLAATYISQGRWKDAAALHAEVLEIQKRVLGQKHPHTLASMNNLASLYFDQGRWDEAEKLGVETLKVRKRVLGEEHIDTLASMHNLASNYSKIGRWTEAEAMQVKVLASRTRLLGEECGDTLDSMANLSTTYGRQGRWQEAEKLQSQVIQIQKRTLGENHPNTLSSMGGLASTYRHQRQWVKAEMLQVETLELEKRVLGVEHAQTLLSMNNLCSIYLDKGEWKKAELLQLEALDIEKRVLGEEHPIALRSMNGLAMNYWENGRWREAEAMQVKVLVFQIQFNGEECPDTLVTMGNLSTTYCKQGRWREAESLQEKVLKIQTRVLGEAHSLTLTSMHNLAMTYSQQEQWQKAKSLRVEILRIHKQVLGKDHPETWSSMELLAYTYQNQGCYRETLRLYMELHNRRMRVLGPAHPDTQASMAKLESFGLPRTLVSGVGMFPFR